MPEKIYRCEKCKKSFIGENAENECIKHETRCLDEDNLIKANFNKAIELLIAKYDITTITKICEIGIKDYEIETSKNVDIYFKGRLLNGMEFEAEDPYWDFEVSNTEDFYNFIEQIYIIPKLYKKYEGKLRYDSISCGYDLDDIAINTICSRFKDKKVRIEIIDD